MRDLDRCLCVFSRTKSGNLLHSVKLCLSQKKKQKQKQKKTETKSKEKEFGGQENKNKKGKFGFFLLPKQSPLHLVSNPKGNKTKGKRFKSFDPPLLEVLEHLVSWELVSSF